MANRLYPVGIAAGKAMAGMPEFFQWFAATIRNLFVLITLPLGADIYPSPAVMMTDRLLTELYFPYSRWLERVLRKKLATAFNGSAFVILCRICPGRHLGDIFERYKAEIKQNQNCLIMMIRAGLEPKMLSTEHDEAAYAATYLSVIKTVADGVLSGELPETLGYFGWCSSPHSLMDGKHVLEPAKLYRALETAAFPAIAPPEHWPAPGARLRVGLFRHDYSPCAEVDLLEGLLSALPGHIDFYFLGFDSPPAAPLDRFAYHRLSDTDLPKAVAEARALRLDAVIFSPPLWSYFGSPRMRLIEHRLALVQLYYLGDVSTSGLKNLDYFMVPTFLNLDQYQPYFTETLFPVACGIPALPQLYAPPPEIIPPQLAKCAGVTYMTLCHIGKINLRLIEAWCEIIKQVPGSRIVISPYPTAGHKELAPLMERALRACCNAKNIKRSAFILTSIAGSANTRKLLREGDVYLDSLPYSGAVSMAEALNAGLPSVCFSDAAYCSQLGSMVAAIPGLQEDIVVSGVEAYIARAVLLGQDKAMREQLGRKIRGRLAGLSKEQLNKEFSMQFWGKAESVIRTSIARIS